MKSAAIAFMTTLFVSGLWLLALADGTVDVVSCWFVSQTEVRQLQDEIETLVLEEKKKKLEMLILEHIIKSKAYRARINYMGSKGF